MVIISLIKSIYLDYETYPNRLSVTLHNVEEHLRVLAWSLTTSEMVYGFPTKQREVHHDPLLSRSVSFAGMAPSRLLGRCDIKHRQIVK